MRKIWFLLGGFVVLSAFPSLVYAVSISQASFDLALPAGTSETGTFVVVNDETEATTVDISLSDWDRRSDGENRFLDVGSVERSAAGWITFAPAQFRLDPDEAVEVRFTMAVPAGVTGSYWAALIVQGTPRKVQVQSGTTILVRKRFAVKILETPPGTGNLSGRIADVRVGGSNPLQTVILFENNGLVNMNAVKGRVEIRDAAGQTVESIPIEAFPILPGATRQLVVSSARPKGDVLPPGRYLILAIIDFGGDSLLGGQLVLELKPLKLVPLGDSNAPPQDLDNDGTFEDVNGDGVFDGDDPVLLGFQLNDPAVQDNARAFDFNNDGVVDFDDTLTLQSLLDKQT